MSIYLPPLARKKKVSGRHRHDTYNIFGDFQSGSDLNTTYKKQFPRHNVPPAQLRATSPGRKHKPQPTRMTFLSSNPRFICEPICHARNNKDDNKNDARWWPADEDLSMEKPVPQYSIASTQRSDYRGSMKLEVRQTRFDCNPTLNTYATGIAPLMGENNNYSKKKEKISYRHQYDCRRTPNEHERGKLHGAFIRTDIPTMGMVESKTLSEQTVETKED